ncbi:MAG: PQQ-binding-like beta-propeller repeat protein [Nannocystaceae bacterium]
MLRKPWRFFLLFAILGLLVLSWWLLKPEPRSVYGLQPISHDTAILLTRHHANDKTRFWVEHVASNGEQLWSKEISPVRTTEVIGRSGIAANEDLIVLLGESAPRSSVVMGLARTTGETLWETPIDLMSLPADQMQPIDRLLHIDGPRVYVVFRHDASSVDTISAISLASGEILWSLPEENFERFRPRLLEPGRLMLPSQPGRYVEVDGATGKKRREYPLDRLGCQIPEGLVGYTREHVVLVSRTGAPTSLELANHVRPAWHGPCGIRPTAHGSDVIVGYGGVGNPLGLARLPTSGGPPKWQLALTGEEFSPWGSTQNGIFPRFTAFSVRTPRSKHTEIVVVDLDHGSIVSRHQVSWRPLVFNGPERAYVILHDSYLHALNPTDGSLEKVTHLGLPPRFEVLPEDYTFGTLWLEGDGSHPPDQLPWVRIDLASGEVHAQPSVQVSDHTADGWRTPE